MAKTAPRTLQRLGVGTQHAAQLLITAGANISRLRNEAAFAHLCGVDPIPASSGKTVRHRLNHGGDRAANSSLHMITVVRLRYCEQTRTYLQRRMNEGKTKRESHALPQALPGSRALPHHHSRPKDHVRTP
ncbi:MAG: transposase [Geodermatophilaceae bacterium]